MYSHLAKHQTKAFLSITQMYLDSESLFINLDFDISNSQMREELSEIYQLKDRISFSREADIGDFWVINFYRSQMYLREYIMTL